MKLPVAVALLIVLCAGAKAAPSPLPVPRPASMTADSALYLGPTGVLLEADYFRPPLPRHGVSRIFPCRLHLRIAQSTRRIVQACD